MQFLGEDQHSAVSAIANCVVSGLKSGKRVLWLVSGGSNVGLEVQIMQLLHKRAKDKLGSLAIFPMDERYGPPGHKDSNTEQLRAAGFKPGEASWVDVLMHNVSFEQTVSFYGDVAATALQHAAIVVGQFGLGADGHIAGLLPNSPATEPTDDAVIGYKWSDYTRLTLSPAALRHVQVAYVPAYGTGKKQALQRLRNHNEPFAELPAELLYELPSVYVYNDQLENKE
ncbi:MAG TPA: 6-phosphogluconolactonase [Candidatus Saccharimonadales bacterium]|nr:6-phosphogluconolactonase [Candidatus Saccharimonadales bacterium]